MIVVMNHGNLYWYNICCLSKFKPHNNVFMYYSTNIHSNFGMQYASTYNIIATIHYLHNGYCVSYSVFPLHRISI